MNPKLLIAFFGIVLVTAGCVKTVNDKHTFGMPLVSDKFEGRYERPVDQVFAAAKEVMQFNGALTSESTLLNTTNNVRTLEGKVNQRTVWIRVEAVDPKVTAVTVQARTKGGGSDKPLVHELEKQIALKLASR